MDPSTPTPTPEQLTPLMYGAIGYILLAFGRWAAENGLPKLREALGMVSQRDKEVAAAAKEGPIMVLEEVKRQLAETKAQAANDKAEQYRQLTEVLLELKEMRKQHGDCEKKHAALEAEVQFLRKEVAELRGEQSN